VVLVFKEVLERQVQQDHLALQAETVVELLELQEQLVHRVHLGNQDLLETTE
jgi:hypothetical protein